MAKKGKGKGSDGNPNTHPNKKGDGNNGSGGQANNNVKGPHPTKNRGDGKKGYYGKGALGKTPGAWKPDSFKTIRKETRRAIRPTFKPAMYDVKKQEQSVKSMDAKRAADNQYYNQWLESQNAQLAAHDAAAQAQVEQRQEQMRQQSIQAMKEIHGQLVEGAGNHTGTVSNANDAAAFDLSAEAQRDLGKIDAANALSQELGQRGVAQNSAARSSNVAMILNAEALRQAETSKALKELGQTRTKIKLEQASAEAQEIARRLTQEIDKAANVIDMRNKAASQWLANKAQRLERKKFRFDQKLQTAQLTETQRHNMATEKIDAMNAKDGGSSENNKHGDSNSEIHQAVNNGVDAITSHPQIKKAVKENPDKAIRMLTNSGFTPTEAAAAVYKYKHGSLSAKWKRKLGIK